eukprot:scaffold133788_cov55-Attheya_sp.AAC.1
MMENRITLVKYWMIPFSDSQLREWLTGTKVTRLIAYVTLSHRECRNVSHFTIPFPPITCI